MAPWIRHCVKLECVPKFCYLEDTLYCFGKCGGGSKSQSEVCLGKVQGVISYPDSSGCIIPHEGKDIHGLCPECIDIWD